MSHKFLFLCLSGLLLLTGLFSTSASVIANPSSDGDEVIIIVQPEGEPTDLPRMPVARIEACYSWSTSSVSATLSNAGDVVEVAFYNFSTGEDYAFEIPGNGLSVMPIGSSSGFWTVSFTLSSGAVYYGTFIL